MAANILITPSAWMKMQTLVMGYDKEVGWYGTVDKLTEKGSDIPTYRITDILVYPQYSNGAYVEDAIDSPYAEDQAEMYKWLKDLSDEQYNKKRFQGHSHVNMGAYYSSTDKDFCRRFATSVSGKDIENPYVITVVMNKKQESLWWICDFEEGKEYTNGEIDYMIEVEEGITQGIYFEDTKSLVKDRVVIRDTSNFLFGFDKKTKKSAGEKLVTKTKTNNNGYPSYGRYYGYQYDDYDSYLFGDNMDNDPLTTNLAVVKNETNEDIEETNDIESFSITIKNDKSYIIEDSTLEDNYYDVVVYDAFGCKFRIKDSTNMNVETTNKMADAKSLAMTLYDCMLDQQYDYFMILKDEDAIDIESKKDVEKYFEMEVKEVVTGIAEDDERIIYFVL